jgi:DNA replicative helicase MCM subunit Mcm2 (Cdc46/Mcm family)
MIQNALQKYVLYVKETFSPQLTQDAMTLLERYYQVRHRL